MVQWSDEEVEVQFGCENFFQVIDVSSWEKQQLQTFGWLLIWGEERPQLLKRKGDKELNTRVVTDGLSCVIKCDFYHFKLGQAIHLVHTLDITIYQIYWMGDLSTQCLVRFPTSVAFGASGLGNLTCREGHSRESRSLWLVHVGFQFNIIF